MSDHSARGPIAFEITKWYGYVIAAMFILYGGVKIILGFLDHTYDGLLSWIVFLLVGVVIVAIATAFRDQKRWGWTGMVVITGLMILGSAVNLAQVLNWVLLATAMAVMVLLMSPATRQHVTGRQ
ncbi:MAG: hypothetical protein RBT76_03525 [candidate division Zixibacteria bacterium]|jgi:hypothetical protein|nr:hypothetical protein [candidate division Zixibacteria bacterium]